MYSCTSGFVCGLRCLHTAGMVHSLFIAIKQGHPRILHLLSHCTLHRMSWNHVSVLMHALSI